MIAPVASVPPGTEHGVGRPGASAVRAVLEAAGLVAAPATLLSALALYFGVVYTHAHAFYFGIDGNTLGLSSREYLLRSADALFLPLVLIVLGGLFLLGTHSLLSRLLGQPRRRHARTAVTWALGAVGAMLFGLGVMGIFRPLPFRSPVLFAPLSLVMGIMGLSYAVSFHRRTVGAPRSWVTSVNAVLVGVIVIVGLFWATTYYARELGRGRAEQLHARLPARPGVVVYSTQRLHLEGSGLEEAVLAEEGTAYRFRYSGLRLYTHAGGKYFLLSAHWSGSDGRAIILPDAEGVRVEFTVGGSA